MISELALISVFVAATQALSPISLSVCSAGCAYTSIQKAVNEAPEGAVIDVRRGNYTEPNAIDIRKAVTLEGEQGAVVQGSGNDNIFAVHANGVTIRGFEIQNSGSSYIHELAAIRVEEVQDCLIVGNTLINNAYGIYLADSENCIVQGNRIAGSIKASEADAGNGIHSWKGNRHHILDNDISGHRDGIYLEFTNNSTIIGNQVSKNERYGLHFMTSNKNEYRSNRFENNGAGVAVMYSREVNMVDNVFANNRGVASYGLLLKDISVSHIHDNLFDDNTVGVYMEDTNRSQFFQNQFKHNGFGLRILGNCDANNFQRNNFISNTFDVATNSSRNPNYFDQNYWSQYGGYDMNSDGVGDVPYRPVSLSSVVVEKLDSSYVLIKSPLLLMLDQIEQSFPMIIPEGLKDEHPLNQPTLYQPTMKISETAR